MFRKIARRLAGSTINHDITQALLGIERETLYSRFRSENPNDLILYGRKVFSQCDEDGIIIEIIRRLGITNGNFLEIGASNGLENNTHALLLQGWKGVWIEGDPEMASQAQASFSKLTESRQLAIINSHVTLENLSSVISTGLEHIGETSIDLMSIDVDGNDVFFLNSIQDLNAKVIVAEYNPKFPLPIRFSIDYNESHRHADDDYWGVSLCLLSDCLERKGYELVCCNLSGVNAFFVRDNLVDRMGSISKGVEKLYQPMRHRFIQIQEGHKVSTRCVADGVRSYILDDEGASETRVNS